MEEKVLLEKAGITVSTTRFVAQGQTYAMANITSVKVGETAPKRGTSIALGLAGVILLMAGAVFWGIVALGIAVFVWYYMKPTYNLLITTAGGEASAMQSEYRDEIETIVSALNQAIIARG